MAKQIHTFYYLLTVCFVIGLWHHCYIAGAVMTPHVSCHATKALIHFCFKLQSEAIGVYIIFTSGTVKLGLP